MGVSAPLRHVNGESGEVLGAPTVPGVPHRDVEQFVYDQQVVGQTELMDNVAQL